MEKENYNSIYPQPFKILLEMKLIKRAIKNEPTVTYSNVLEGHKIKPK